MTGEQLIIELVSIVETTCYPRFDRDYGTQEPISDEQWEIVVERVMALADRNKVKP